METARKAGATWAEIGVAAGLAPVAARRLYGMTLTQQKGFGFADRDVTILASRGCSSRVANGWTRQRAGVIASQGLTALPKPHPLGDEHDQHATRPAARPPFSKDSDRPTPTASTRPSADRLAGRP